jgi:hypothetical protein
MKASATLQRQFCLYIPFLGRPRHIHVPVSHLYIPRIGPHISSSRKGRPILGIYNVEIGTEAPIFLFWDYLFQIFGILSLQCSVLQQHALEIHVESLCFICACILLCL